MTILLWILIGFVIYSFLVAILARLALKKELYQPQYGVWKRVWKIKKKSFLISYLYRDNCAIDESRCVIVVPKDICQLYVGIYLGLFFGLMYLGALSITLIFIFGPGTIFAFFLGYLPTPRRFFIDKPFKKMKCGAAPWKIILPIGLIVGTVIFFEEISGVMVKIPDILEIPKVNRTILAFTACVVMCLVVLVIRKTKLYKKSKCFFYFFVQKYLCKEIEIQDE